MTRARGGIALVALLAVSCGAAEQRAAPGEPVGSVRVELVAGAGGPALTRVRVAFAPLGTAVDLALQGSTWVGTVSVPAGVQQTVTATAWAGADAVGQASVTVTAGQHDTALVSITILDTSQRPAGADHGPVVSAISASTLKPTVGVQVTLTATAVDPDGHAMTYGWQDSCGGTFTLQARSTKWTPATSGWCTVTVTASSRGLSGTKTHRTLVAARPEVTIAEDLDYAASGDPLGTYAYQLGDGSYGELTDAGSVAFAGSYDRIRLVRYVVSNAGADPVAIDPVTIPRGWELVEGWAGLPPALATGQMDAGTTCADLAAAYTLTPSCAVGGVWAGAIAGPEVLGQACTAPLDPSDEAAPRQSGDITSQAYDLDANGLDLWDAALVSGKYVVPAASGGVPGRIALYLVRPVSSGRAVPMPLWTGGTWLLTQNVWLKASEPSWTGSCAGTGQPGEAGATWEEWEWRHRVDVAEDWLTGGFVLTAYTISSGALQGLPVPIRDVDASRMIAH